MCVCVCQLQIGLHWSTNEDPFDILPAEEPLVVHSLTHTSPMPHSHTLSHPSSAEGSFTRVKAPPRSVIEPGRNSKKLPHQPSAVQTQSSHRSQVSDTDSAKSFLSFKAPSSQTSQKETPKQGGLSPLAQQAQNGTQVKAPGDAAGGGPGSANGVYERVASGQGATGLIPPTARSIGPCSGPSTSAGSATNAAVARAAHRTPFADVAHEPLHRCDLPPAGEDSTGLGSSTSGGGAGSADARMAGEGVSSEGIGGGVLGSSERGKDSGGAVVDKPVQSQGSSVKASGVKASGDVASGVKASGDVASGGMGNSTGSVTGSVKASGDVASSGKASTSASHVSRGSSTGVRSGVAVEETLL